MGDALHHAAVAEDAVGVVIDHVEALAVELGRQMLFRHGHAYGVGDALTQRAGGGLNAHGVLVLGVAGGLGAELTEGLEVVDGQAVAEQVQKGVQQHRAVAGGKHEAVAVDELGISGVVGHLAAPHGVGHGGRAHRHAGVAGLGLLYGLGAENADGVDDHLFLVHGEHLLYRLCWSLRYEQSLLTTLLYHIRAVLSAFFQECYKNLFSRVLERRAQGRKVHIGLIAQQAASLASIH